MKPFSERRELSLNSVARRLFSLMDKKQSNLCVACDVLSQNRVLEIADLIGPHIVVLKTHVDILEDFTSSFGAKIREMANKHEFLVFEDRKFADIGSTVQKQYQKGIYKIMEWADIVNAHPLIGPSIIEALKGNFFKEKGLLLIAELSCQGSLITPEYTRQTVQLAENAPDFVMGFIAQKKIAKNPAFLHMTPGVKWEEGGDLLGQIYQTPHEVIAKRKSDIIIVGRGIIESDDVKKSASFYQKMGWESYISQFQ